MKTNSLSSYLGTGMLAICATIGQAWMVNTARAANAPASQSLRLTVNDLDLSKQADVATLYARIKSAANQACGADVVTGSRLPSKDMKQCLSQAIDGAMVQINNPTLTALHKHEAGKAGA